MVTVFDALVAGAFILTLVSAIGKCPVWVPLLLVVIVLALQVLHT